MTDISVVLPAPLRPSSPWILSFSKFSVTLSRATVSLNRRVTPWASIATTFDSEAGIVIISPRYRKHRDHESSPKPLLFQVQSPLPHPAEGLRSAGQIAQHAHCAQSAARPA